MVLIIAEIGVNHNGCINTAKKLIDVAVKSGADVVKFQTFKADELTNSDAPLAEYQLKNSPEFINQKKLLEELELSEEDHILLKNYSQNLGIEFLSTAFTTQSIDLLVKLGMKRWKIPSGEINNIPLLKKIAIQNQPTILSTGMSTLGEIEFALKTLYDQNLPKKKITLLHCNSAYPTPMEDANLKAMNTIKESFDINVGYSDHTCGIEACIAAVALGAQIIEKHITLNKNMKGPDHKASIEPKELLNLVSSIRNIEKALGDGIKKPRNSEIKNIKVARKSIIASKFIDIGEVYTTENICIKRPGTGIPPTMYDSLLGMKSNRKYKPDEIIELN